MEPYHLTKKLIGHVASLASRILGAGVNDRGDEDGIGWLHRVWCFATLTFFSFPLGFVLVQHIISVVGSTGLLRQGLNSVFEHLTSDDLLTTLVLLALEVIDECKRHIRRGIFVPSLSVSCLLLLWLKSRQHVQTALSCSDEGLAKAFSRGGV